MYILVRRLLFVIMVQPNATYHTPVGETWISISNILICILKFSSICRVGTSLFWNMDWPQCDSQTLTDLPQFPVSGLSNSI